MRRERREYFRIMQKYNNLRMYESADRARQLYLLECMRAICPNDRDREQTNKTIKRVRREMHSKI